MDKTIANLKKLKSFHNGSYGADIDKAIKALEQENILDKIRTEIIDMRSKQNCSCSDCLDIIDKYREGEDDSMD